ncbi:MAG TPA: fumarylacetoacetate hydrolase family protein [Polyangiaceae bacterium]|nr:fumarylacetoacetate hydrolase family protein [Polyangiaceae bacterium]
MKDGSRQRYARVRSAGGAPAWVVLEGESARRLTAAPWDGGTPSAEQLSPAALLCPVLPSKIIGIGRNYRLHAAELGSDVPSEPLLFLKPPSALLDPNGAIELPPQSQRVEHEGELGVVIGHRCRRVTTRDALDYVLGYTAVCDVTARDLQKKDGQWTRAKGFDGFCPAGPHIVTGLDTSDLSIQVRVNGEIRQNGRTRDMIFPVAELVAYISEVMTLEPGDLICTGTPHGVSPLSVGDRVAVFIDEIGSLEFDVRHS